MIIQELPYEWIQKFFGTFTADNFNAINLSLTVIGLVITILMGRKISFRLRNNQNNTFKVDFLEEEDEEPEEDEEESSIYQARHGEWSTTGWVYDRDTMKWDPPDYLEEESRKKWRWDEEKRIWIDVEKEKRIERHKQWRREQGKGPTFEEWKAMQEQKK